MNTMTGGIFSAFNMKNKTYDALKYIAQYILPALATLYFALSEIWNLPYGAQVVGTITAIDAFLGVVLGISSSNYSREKAYDGLLVIDENNPNKDVYTLELRSDVTALKDKDVVKFKVSQETQRL